jgi:hypothetical protein
MKVVHPDALRHMDYEHGKDSGQQVAMTAQRARLVDWVMDEPDQILPPGETHAVEGERRMELVKVFPGIGVYHVIVRYSDKRVSPVTMWIVAESPSLTSKTHRDNQSPAR